MPIYEFRCFDCDQTFEIINPKGLVRCPKCWGDRIEKLPSVPAPAQFKGTGFYATDYKPK